MGSALLSQWVSGGEKITVVDPMASDLPNGVSLVRDREEIADQRFDCIVAAVKPQMFDDVMPNYAGNLSDDGYVLSIAAGYSAGRLSKLMGDKPVVRVMPNLPAAIGRGVSGLCAGPLVSDAHMAHAEEFMSRAGTTIVVDSEETFDGARSLRMYSTIETRYWPAAVQNVEISPSTPLVLQGYSKATNIRIERDQEPLYYVAIAFLDSMGQAVGEPVYGRLDSGDHDWEMFQVKAVSPENAAFAKNAAEGVEIYVTDAEVVRGLYLWADAPDPATFDEQASGEDRSRARATLVFSGSANGAARVAATELAERWNVAVDLWSATSYKRLREEALAVERRNRLHPEAPAEVPLVTRLLADGEGPVVAVTDYQKLVPGQVARWVPRPYHTLGTDGFGRSDTREALRRFFEVDVGHVVVAVLHALSQEGTVPPERVAEAIAHHGIDVDAADPGRYDTVPNTGRGVGADD